MSNKMDLRLFSFVVSAIFGLALFLIFGATKEGEQPKVGSNLVLYRGHDSCLHLHHYTLMLLMSLTIVATVYGSQGIFTPTITGVLGFMFGASLADLRYNDFLKFRVSCKERN